MYVRRLSPNGAHRNKYQIDAIAHYLSGFEAIYNFTGQGSKNQIGNLDEMMASADAVSSSAEAVRVLIVRGVSVHHGVCARVCVQACTWVVGGRHILCIAPARPGNVPML